MNTKTLALSLVGAMAGFGASALTVDFNSLSGGYASYTQDGITFTSTGNEGLYAAIDPNGTPGLLGLDSSEYVPIEATIAGGANSVSVDLGDYDEDADLLFLDVYSSANVLLGSTTYYLPSSVTGMETLTVSAPGISYAIFGSISPPSVDGSSVYADNFTIPSSAPDSGSSMELVLGGLTALGFVARSRKQ